MKTIYLATTFNDIGSKRIFGKFGQYIWKYGSQLLFV